MFCPQCGTNQSDELKFCKLCGANLYAVRQVVATREIGEKFDWSKTWVAEMFLSEVERNRRKGMTPDMQRSKEVKAGVITASAGIGVAIFLYVFMQGVILSRDVPPDGAEILRRLWIVGVIPLCVGLGLIFNGLVVGRRSVRAAGDELATPGSLKSETNLQFPPSADTAGFDPPPFSVTDETTRHLKGPDRKDSA